MVDIQRALAGARTPARVRRNRNGLVNIPKKEIDD
jgi:hypothetical protein